MLEVCFSGGGKGYATKKAVNDRLRPDRVFLEAILSFEYRVPSISELQRPSFFVGRVGKCGNS